MITRALIAAVLTATTLTGVALQRGVVRDDVRPGLLLFSDPPNCSPCRDLDRDYHNLPDFRKALNSMFRCYPKYNPAEHLDLFRKHKIESVPTWIVVDGAGNEIHRVPGYTTPAALLQSLSHKCANGVCTPITRTQPAPPVNPPAQPHAPPDARLERLIEANEALRSEIDGLRGQQSDLKRQILDAKRQPADDPGTAQQVAALESRLKSLADDLAARNSQHSEQIVAIQSQLAAARAAEANAAAEAEKLRQRLALPPAPLWIPRPQTASESPPNASPPPANASPAATDASEAPAIGPTARPFSETASRWTGVLGSLAVGAAKVAAPEFAIPLSLALGGLALWRKKKTGRQLTTAKSAGLDHATDQLDNTLPRDNTEIEQIIGLRQQEQREPIHDAFFGVLFEDEYRTNPDQSVREAWSNALDRFNRTAPLSTRSQTTTSTTTAKKG